MAQLVIPAAGAALGWYTYGTTGAQIGWMLGSMLSAEDQEIEMPTIGDLRVQTSGYGSIIPFISGKQRLAGNIIWSTDKVAHQSSSSEGGKGFSAGSETSATITTYTISMAIAICQGPILGITRVWEDGILTADVGSGQTKSPGSIYVGNDTQGVDPVMEAHEGVNNVPAYRGISYIVMEDFDLGAAGRVPQFSFEVVKEEAL